MSPAIAAAAATSAVAIERPVSCPVPERALELLGQLGAKLGVGAGGEPCRHSPCDAPDRLDPVSLRLARRLAEPALGAS